MGAPGWGGRGAVFTASSLGGLSQIATGKATGDRLGERLARVPDTDTDGKPELLVGAPGASCEAGSRCGRGYLMKPDGSALGFINGTQAGVEAGRYVAFGPDLDGDGLPSLVLVEPVPTSAAGMGRSQFFER